MNVNDIGASHQRLDPRSSAPADDRNCYRPRQKRSGSKLPEALLQTVFVAVAIVERRDDLRMMTRRLASEMKFSTTTGGPLALGCM